MCLRKYLEKTAFVGFVSWLQIICCAFQQPSCMRQAGSLTQGQARSRRSGVLLLAALLSFPLLTPSRHLSGWWLAEEPLCQWGLRTQHHSRIFPLVLKDPYLWHSIQVCIVNSMVFPVVMYRCESWITKKAECQRIDAFKLWCWRRLVRVPWTARRSTSQSQRKSALNIHWKDWCWSSNTLATWWELTH